MGGRGPPYWMKCLMCLAKIDEKSQFFIGIKKYFSMAPNLIHICWIKPVIKHT